GWHSVIVADVEEQSRNIRAMYSRLALYHPKEIFDVKFKNFEGSSKNKIMERRDGVIYIGSMQKPDALRSADVMMAHLSEVGLWRATEGKRPEDVVQSIAGTVPLEPYSIIVMESTAKGVGNFFHRQWQKAVCGESGYIPVFVAWFEIDIYSKPFDSDLCREKFARSLSEDELSYFNLGATLEAIHWYRTKKHTDSYDNWRMCCEFPTTEFEAFQSTGRRAHAPNYISAMRKYTCQPKYKGNIFSDAPYGKHAIDSSLRFEACDGGDFWVWTLPDATDTSRRRYVVSMDIGGRTRDADWSVISVIDRYWLDKGGVEECVATFRFHLDQDLAVWKAVQVAVLYNHALLVVEANSLNPKSTDGDHTLTILDEIKEFYSNLYCRTDPQKIVEGRAQMYGFFTTKASKTDLVNQMNRRYRECGYIERDARALDEADCYEIKEDGSYGAVDGEHDDIYMSRAIGLKASATY
ncbi:MAG: terminase, partial [Rikenellaceae bacterium]